MSGDAKWLRDKLDKHKEGSHPGTTLNLTTKQAERLVEHIERLERKEADARLQDE